MSEENNEITEGHSDYKPADSHNESIKHQLTGMYQNWFLDYASYVILERAVPHINDGLKPVQRRILHSMKRMDDGRYNKVANIVGHTMQFHLMAMHPSVTHWYSWGRKTCWLTARETGVISLPVTVLLLLVILKHACRSLHSM